MVLKTVRGEGQRAVRGDGQERWGRGERPVGIVILGGVPGEGGGGQPFGFEGIGKTNLEVSHK